MCILIFLTHFLYWIVGLFYCAEVYFYVVKFVNPFYGYWDIILKKALLALGL